MFYWFPRSGWKAVSKLPKEHTRNIWERCQKPRGFSWTSIRAWSLFCRKAMEWRWSSPKMLKLWIRPPGIQLGQNLLSLLAGSGSCWPILLFHHCDFSWKHINIRGGGSTHLLPPFSSPYHAESSISSGFAAGNSILNSPWCFAYTLLTEASWVGLIFCSAAAEGHFFHASISVELEALREGTMGPWMWMDVDGCGWRSNPPRAGIKATIFRLVSLQVLFSLLPETMISVALLPWLSCQANQARSSKHEWGREGFIGLVGLHSPV